MENFFETEKDYNRKMLYFLSNIYLLIHFYHSYEYYQENSSMVIFSSIPIYYISSFLKLDEKDFENIQIILTSMLFIHDLNIY